MPFRNVFHQLLTEESTIAWVVYGLVALTMLTALVLSRRRRRRGREPSKRMEANKLEIGYLAVLSGIVAFLMVTSLAGNSKELPDPPEPALRVQVTGFQWCWRFHYEGQPVTVTGQCRGGSFPALVLPAGEPVELDLTSIDVIHAFWLPYLRFKMYAYPDHVNSFTTTLTQTGRWLGRCAQLCGLYHYDMDFCVQVVSPAASLILMRSSSPRKNDQWSGNGCFSAPSDDQHAAEVGRRQQHQGHADQRRELPGGERVPAGQRRPMAPS